MATPCAGRDTREMKSRKRRVGGKLAEIALAGFLVAGCDDGGTTPTSEEAADLARLFVWASIYSIGSDTTPPDEEVNFDSPCPEGGSVSHLGRVDSFGGVFSGNFALDHCAQKRVDGTTIVLTGRADAWVVIGFSHKDGIYAIELDGDWNGSFTWEEDIGRTGRGGACEVNVELDVTSVVTDAGVERVDGGITGTACVYSVDADVDHWFEDVTVSPSA